MIVAFVSILFIVATAAAEWLDIRPMPSVDTLHVHFDDQMLSPPPLSTAPAAPAPVKTTTTAPPVHPFTIYDRLGVAVTVQPNSPPTVVVPPIRYEDLEHIVGPGFEADLERFYEQHKHELDESTRRADVAANESSSSSISSSSKPPKIYYVPGDDDPWSQYDRPLLVASENEDNLTADSTTEEPDNEDESQPIIATTTPQSVGDMLTSETTNQTTRKRLVKLVPVRVVAVPAQAMLALSGTKQKQKQQQQLQQQPSIGFPGFVTFLRGIQDSIVSNTASSIQDKMSMLQALRDRMLRQIKKNIRSLWPTTPPAPDQSAEQTDRKPRTKREAEWSHHNGMEFPSSEGALMTLSFLTFAVFLIKLVLQVINTIKSKHYSYNSFDAVNNGGGTVTALNVIKHNRNARHAPASGDNDAESLTPGGLSVNEVLKAVHRLKN